MTGRPWTIVLCLLQVVTVQAGSLPSQTSRDFSIWSGMTEYIRCLELHSCTNSTERMFNTSFADNTKLCSCNQESCSRYNTCCRDVVSSPPSKYVPTQCLSQHKTGGDNFHISSVCPDDYQDKEISSRCETPLGDAPTTTGAIHWIVTSNNTGYTYRNIYCGLCNGESMTDLIFWDIDLRCNHELLLKTQPHSYDLHSSCELFYTDSSFPSADECSPDVIASCSESHHNESIASLCENGSMAIVYDQREDNSYRNIYCALCNNVTTLDSLACAPIEKKKGEDMSLRVVVNPFTNRCHTLNGSLKQTDSEICQTALRVFSDCPEREMLNWTNQMCEPICDEHQMWQASFCETVSKPRAPESSRLCSYVSAGQLVNMFTDTDNSSTLVYETDSIQWTVEDKHYCTKCNWVTYHSMEVTMNKNETEMTTPQWKTIHKPLFKKINKSMVVVCQEIIDYHLLRDLCLHVDQQIVSLITLSMSMVCLIILIAVYVILPSLHNVPGYMVLSQAVSQLLTFALFLLRIPAAKNYGVCYAVAVLSHYFILANCGWVLLFAVEITTTINSDYAVINQRSRKRYCRYSMVGWIVPFVPVFIAIVVDQVESMSRVAPQYGAPLCWFASNFGLFLYLLVPVSATLIANLVAYLAIIVRFAVLAYQTRGAKHTHVEKLKLSLKLFFAFGLLWIVGIAAAFWRENNELACLFLFANSLSGILLMLVFICNRNIYRGLRQRFTGSSGKRIIQHSSYSSKKFKASTSHDDSL